MAAAVVVVAPTVEGLVTAVVVAVEVAAVECLVTAVVLLPLDHEKKV